jgi:hypothetical protein
VAVLKRCNKTDNPGKMQRAPQNKAIHSALRAWPTGDLTMALKEERPFGEVQRASI